MVEIHFGPMAVAWSKDMTKNKYFAEVTINYFHEVLKARGYLYLNTLFEAFGVAWSPDTENICFRSEEEFKPIFSLYEDEIVIIL